MKYLLDFLLFMMIFLMAVLMTITVFEEDLETASRAEKLITDCEKTLPRNLHCELNAVSVEKVTP